MKTFLVNLFWIIIGLIFLASGIIVSGLMIPSIVLILLIFTWRFILYLKSRRKNAKNIPQDTLDDLEIAERGYVESNGQTEPHEILWQIARTKQRGLRTVTEAKPRAETGELYTPYIKRSEFQSNPIAINTNTTSGIGRSTSRPQRNNRKGLFNRRR